MTLRAGLVWLGLLTGCDNACEQLCETMAELSAECGNSVGEAEIDACMAAYAASTAEENQICGTFGHPDVIRNEWTCDDVNLYRKGGGTPE